MGNEGYASSLVPWRGMLLYLVLGVAWVFAGDVLLALTVHGNDPNLLAAAEAAHERDMTVVVLAGRTGGKLAAMLRETDVLISVPHDRAARVREVHTLVLHCISDGVDAQLLGEQEIPL